MGYCLKFLLKPVQNFDFLLLQPHPAPAGGTQVPQKTGFFQMKQNIANKRPRRALPLLIIVCVNEGDSYYLDTLVD